MKTYIFNALLILILTFLTFSCSQSILVPYEKYVVQKCQPSYDAFQHMEGYICICGNKNQPTLIFEYWTLEEPEIGTEITLTVDTWTENHPNTK